MFLGKHLYPPSKVPSALNQRSTTKTFPLHFVTFSNLRRQLLLLVMSTHLFLLQFFSVFPYIGFQNNLVLMMMILLLLLLIVRICDVLKFLSVVG
jgi:hypothetical protein